MKAVFDGGSLKKVRFLMWLALFLAVLTIWGGFNMAQTYGLRPIDGGVLAPLSVRLAWSAGVVSLGIIFAVGMWFYGRVSVAKIEFDEGTRIFYIHTVRLIGIRKEAIDPSTESSTSYQGGRLSSSIAMVNAPWGRVRLSRRKWPLVLAHHGDVLDEQLMREVTKARKVVVTDPTLGGES